MLLQLGQGQSSVDRRTVVQDMKVTDIEVDDLLASGILDERIPYIPFARDPPVEDPGAGANLVYLQVNVLTEMVQRLSHAVTRDATTDGKDRGGERVDLTSDVGVAELLLQQAIEVHVPP